MPSPATLDVGENPDIGNLHGVRNYYSRIRKRHAVSAFDKIMARLFGIVSIPVTSLDILVYNRAPPRLLNVSQLETLMKGIATMECSHDNAAGRKKLREMMKPTLSQCAARARNPPEADLRLKLFRGR
jgi:hypothetical protein